MSEAQHAPEGQVIEGRYRVVSRIADGGMATVYQAVDERLGRTVAIKIMHTQLAQGPQRDQFVERFHREARSAAAIANPHIVQVYDTGEFNGLAYLVMEYLSGISIGREMRQREYKPYSAAELSEIINPVMDALEAMHDQRIVHSDISPGNIMRTSNGDICLIDMGAAKYTNTARPVLSAAFLKVNYAAPEQYRTARQGIPYDEGSWTDIYALGATIYYLLTGQKPPDIIKRLEGKTTKLCLPKKPRVKRARQWQTFLGHAMEPEIKERIGSIRQFREESKGLLN